MPKSVTEEKDRSKLLSVCTGSVHVQLFATPQTVARQAPLSMEFSRQEYRSGLPFPPPEHVQELDLSIRKHVAWPIWEQTQEEIFFTRGETFLQLSSPTSPPLPHPRPPASWPHWSYCCLF